MFLLSLPSIKVYASRLVCRLLAGILAPLFFWNCRNHAGEIVYQNGVVIASDSFAEQNEPQ